MVCPVEAVDDFEWRGGPSDAWFVNWDKALAQARKTDKALFILRTGSDWCGWCMKLRSEVLTTPEFEDFARKNLVLLYLDSPRRNPLGEDQKAHNEMIARALSFGGGVPHVLIVNANGEKLGSIGGGGLSLEAYLGRLRDILAADGEKITRAEAVRLFTEGYDTPAATNEDAAVCELPADSKAPNREEPVVERRTPEVSPFTLDPAPLRKAFDASDIPSYKSKNALKDFEKAVADANAAAIAQRTNVTELARKYLKDGMDKARGNGDLDKVIAYEKALETLDGDLVGDTEEIVRLRNARVAQLVKINNGLAAAGLTAATALKGVVELQKRETTQKGDFETAKKLASFQNEVQNWENSTRKKVQTARQVSAQPPATRGQKHAGVREQKPVSGRLALPTMTCKLIKTTNEEKNTNWHSVMTGEPVRVKMKSMTYEVSVRNTASTNETYQICWYVIGENNFRNRTSVVEKHKENISCAAGRTTVKHFQTQPYISSKASAKQENYANMSDMDSFKDIIVQLVHDGQVIRAYVPTKKYEAQANHFPFTLQD